MVGSKQTGRRAGTPGSRTDAEVTALVGVRQLIERAGEVRLRAPELTAVLGERAAALAEQAGAQDQWIQAEALAVHAAVRLGDRAAVVGRAVAVLRAAEAAGYRVLAARLRNDVAVCARSAGIPLTALAVLRPVLADVSLPPAPRAAALAHLVGCLAYAGNKPELDQLLVEADRLCAADESVDPDSRFVLRALLHVAASAHHRRHGELARATEMARAGLGLLAQLTDESADGGVVRIRLVLELVCSLLDQGQVDDALELAESVLAKPIRAAEVAPAGWLRLAIATRAHLPAGAADAASRLLRDAAHEAELHGLHGLASQVWQELGHIEEKLRGPAEALACLHSSRAADRAHSHARRKACAVLTAEFGTGEQSPDEFAGVLGKAPRAESRVPSARAGDPVAERRERSAEAVPAPESESRGIPRQYTGPAVERPESDRGAAPGPAPTSDRGAVPEASSNPAPQARPRMAPEPPGTPARPPVSEPVAETAPPPRPEPERRPAPPWRRVAADAGSPVPGFSAERGTAAGAPDGPVTNTAEPNAAEPNARAGDAAQPDAARPNAAVPGATASEATVSSAAGGGTAGESTDRHDLAGQSGTRHDVEHGSVTARSVLDRLGIGGTGSSAGGRRRAPDEASGTPSVARPDPSPAAPDPGRPERSWAPTVGSPTAAQPGDPAASSWPASPAAHAPPSTTPEPSPPGRFLDTELSGDRRAEDSAGSTAHTSFLDRLAPDPQPEPIQPETSRAETARETGPTDPVGAAPPAGSGAAGEESDSRETRPANEQADEHTSFGLTSPPRLRLPPPLPAPEEFAAETPAYHEPASPPFDSFPTDELPEDAGLADLLARALAEHRAGMSSAAALVKDLSGQPSVGESRRPVNGSGHVGDSSASGRHRSGDQ